MSEILTIAADEIVPDRAAVLDNQGIPPDEVLPPATEAVYQAAFDLLTKVAAPVGILAELSVDEFAGVYRGDGWNEPSTPVGDIFPRSEHLALFAATLGPEVSREITSRFESNDLAMAAMLDAAASAAADKAADVVERRFCAALSDNGRMKPDTGVLRYSPGYCGWHISGQGRLFKYLEPEQIGISLRETYLMDPLKSVSGVIIAGPGEIHDFRSTYPSCTMCETHGCRQRIRKLLDQSNPEPTRGV
ncbi:MAG TPA: vitamin B12 dependent-methionine synthase activation domain-containing protein [Phycisphaerae bacterium]|nr:vitamin B12 dependent-methionine synthase activation domain-containing protein [Phycisphaerae bacterium]